MGTKENRDREKLLQRRDEILLIEDFDLEQIPEPKHFDFQLTAGERDKNMLITWKQTHLVPKSSAIVLWC